MLYFINANGEIILSQPETVYQGSNLTNKLYIVAPLNNRLMADIIFLLPNGDFTEPFVLTPAGELPDDLNIKNDVGVWFTYLNSTVTQYAGSVTAQVRFYTVQEEENKAPVLATEAFVINISVGVTPLLPATPDNTTWQELLSLISQLYQNDAHLKAIVFSAQNEIVNNLSNGIDYYQTAQVQYDNNQIRWITLYSRVPLVTGNGLKITPQANLFQLSLDLAQEAGTDQTRAISQNAVTVLINAINSQIGELQGDLTDIQGTISTETLELWNSVKKSGTYKWVYNGTKKFVYYPPAADSPVLLPPIDLYVYILSQGVYSSAYILAPDYSEPDGTTGNQLNLHVGWWIVQSLNSPHGYTKIPLNYEHYITKEINDTGEPTSITYDSTDGINITSVETWKQQDDSERTVTTNREIPLVAGDGIVMDVTEETRRVNIKVDKEAVSPQPVIIEQVSAEQTQGTITDEQLSTLQASTNNYIVFGNEYYYLADKEHTTGILTYTHTGYDEKAVIKNINITIATKAWTLTKATAGIDYLELPLGFPLSSPKPLTAEQVTLLESSSNVWIAYPVIKQSGTYAPELLRFEANVKYGSPDLRDNYRYYYSENYTFWMVRTSDSDTATVVGYLQSKKVLRTGSNSIYKRETTTIVNKNAESSNNDSAIPIFAVENGGDSKTCAGVGLGTSTVPCLFTRTGYNDYIPQILQNKNGTVALTDDIPHLFFHLYDMYAGSPDTPPPYQVGFYCEQSSAFPDVSALQDYIEQGLYMGGGYPRAINVITSEQPQVGRAISTTLYVSYDNNLMLALGNSTETDKIIYAFGAQLITKIL